jgi:glucosyl-3-phosphoglycerate synthase
LIHRAEVQYVKAFYDRPLNYSSGLRSSGGGRVTEILIRPLFSLFYPELTNIIQPLSGEYAARREVLEIIPFPIGYGVETSHLLDLYLKYGLNAFAQTDLDRRVHRNQTTNALGKMSFGILQTFINRLHSQGKIDRIPDMETFYRRFQVEDGSYNQLTQEVVEEERRPMIEVAGYQNRKLSS